jgi:hypothetical protein
MKSVLLAVLFLVLLAADSQSWTTKTYQLVVVKSTKLMPYLFRTVMMRHQEEILTGCLKPDDRAESEHRYDVTSKSGFLQDRILALTEQIPQKIHDHKSFREVAVDFGRLAHYMCDLNDPLIIENSDPREPQYAKDFAIYLEKNIEKFPWVFDSHENDTLHKNLKEYLFQVASHAGEKYARLGEAYFPNGVLVSSDTFDPRSLPFGIASLSYSHSINDTVQVWFYTWRKSHADIGYTPLYRHESK